MPAEPLKKPTVVAENDVAADNSVKYKLPYKVQAHGEEVDTLTFREPTGSDIVSNGNPVRVGEDSSWVMDSPSMERHMSALAAVPPSTIKQLKAKEWNGIAFMLFYRFFTPGAPQE